MQNVAATNPHVQPPQQAMQQPAPAQQQAPPAQPPHPDLQRPPAGNGESREAPIWVKPSDWTEQQNRIRELTEFKRGYDRELELKESERVRIMAEKGQIEEAFKQDRDRHEKKYAELQQRAEVVERNWLNKERSLTINEALAGREFLGDPVETAQMVRELLEREVEAIIGTDGKPYVRDVVTLRPAADYLKERLASSRFKLFFKASTGGGSGTDGTRTDATMANNPAPRLSPEETIKAWQNSEPKPAFGLHRRQA